MALSIEPDRRFVDRHIGSDPEQVQVMLGALGLESLEQLVDATLPASIRMKGELGLPEAISERELLNRLHVLGSRNQIFRSYLGMGYHGTVVPGVIKRNI